MRREHDSALNPKTSKINIDKENFMKKKKE